MKAAYVVTACGEVVAMRSCSLLSQAQSSCSRFCHSRSNSRLSDYKKRLVATASLPDQNEIQNGADNTFANAFVTITYRGRVVKATKGSKLRTALLKAGLSPHNNNANVINCRGLGTCGTCAVEVRGALEPGNWTQAEQLRLNFPPHLPPSNKKLRLACQVRCMGDLEVIKYNGFWGSANEPVPQLAPDERVSIPPLGALELVLDPSSNQVAAFPLDPQKQ